MRVIDTFLFFNELDLLEIRLNSLAPFVDRFVLCECPMTHSGAAKPLWFADNKDRYKDFPITHLISPPRHTDKPQVFGQVDGYAWKREHRQRDYCTEGLADVPDDAIILHGDLDEIPILDDYKGREGAFKQKMYYYCVNVYTGVSNWKGTVAIRKDHITDMNDVRNRRNQYPTIANPGGWHFSTMGTAENIKLKIGSIAHSELNKPEFLDRIADNRAQLLDPYNRGASNWRQEPQTLKVEMPSGPKYLLDNKDKYKHLFYGGLAS